MTLVAIIGMSGRFPGARDLQEFLQNLEDGVESITRFSDDELLQAGVARELLSNPNYVKAAPLLPDADQFAASFFDYSPREAAIMDPQQRLFLECAWEAFEDAGHVGDAYGSNTGVFSGAGGIMSTYLLSDTHFNSRLTGTTASLQHVGNDKDYLSTRVSYKLNLLGPSLTVQTACSTSLVAVHLACQSLLNGECDMALAGGTTVRVPQRTGYVYREGNVFSRDGHCRTFDADAQGTVFGSGVGVVLLKRLKDAIADRDDIHAIIRGTAINNDGSAKTSYWAPDAEGQARAMRQALAIARVDPDTIGYVEAHGTATRIGDPTEVRALAQAFGTNRRNACAIGSVKSNIGHPESAAGIAGLIKTVLSLKHKTFFPSLHYARPNPLIDFANRAFYVSATRRAWEDQPFPRRAGVNSLGIGGTNAFAILEEAPQVPNEQTDGDRPCYVLTVSAKSANALNGLAERFGQHFSRHPGESLANVCFSANRGRAHFAHRLALVASSLEEARAQLAAVDVSTGRLQRGHVAGDLQSRIAFLFSGQGSQYVNMGRELYDTNATFREQFNRCSEIVSPVLDRPLARVVYPTDGSDSSIDETAYTQPALFAIEYALATLWESWGVKPSIVIGHSVGELVAACLAGVMSVEDALRLVAARGRLMQALPRDGSMAVLRCEPGRVEEAIGPYRDDVAVAAINGPHDVVVSGRAENVKAVAATLEREGVRVTPLMVSHAFHSPLMEPMLVEFRQVAQAITYAPPAIPLISNVTGSVATADVATPEYWVRHVREPVRFADGVTAVHEAGVDVFLEVGPSAALLGMARQCVPDEGRVWVPSLRRGRSDWGQIAESTASLYVRGVGIDWAAVEGDGCRHRVHLPTYPFERKRYWIDPPPVQTVPARSPSGSLLGQRLRLPKSSEIRFETQWSPDAPPYLNDHRIFDTVVVPGASHIAMVLAAVKDTWHDDGCVIDDILFPQALVLSDDDCRVAQLIMTREQSGEHGGSAFQVMSLRSGDDGNEPGSWMAHATGTITRLVLSWPAIEGSGVLGPSDALPSVAPLAAWQTRCTRYQSGAEFYARFWTGGYHLGPAFQWIKDVWAGDGEVLCQMAWPELLDDATTYPLYPSLIDACFQFVFGDAASTLLTADAVYVPFHIRRLVLNGSPRPGSPLWCHARVSEPDGVTRQGVHADITLVDVNGQVVAAIEGCELREVRREALLHEANQDLSRALYTVDWREEARDRTAALAIAGEPGVWLVLADGSGVGNGVIERLTAQHQQCIRIDVSPQYRRVAADRYELSAEEPGDFRRLVGEALGEGSLPCRGVIHLWALDTVPMDQPASPASRAQVGRSVLHLVQAVAQAEWAETPRVCLVTRGAQAVGSRPGTMAVEQAPLWGLGRVIALEHPELGCVRVDLDPATDPGDVQRLVNELLAPDPDDQIAYRQGTRYVPRLVRWQLDSELPGDNGRVDAAKQPMQVRLSRYGQLENLTLQPSSRRPPGPGEVEIEVRAAGLNFRDVLNALGLLETHYAEQLGVTSAAQMRFGFECAGTVVAVGANVPGLAVGDDVIAAGTHEALGSFVTLRHEFVVSKTATLSFDEAAGLPLAFLTAYYGLHVLANVTRGDRVLIHAAAGGVGLACVRWAQRVGAEVFATASPGKWAFLRSNGVRYVMSSRTLEFADTIAELTGGEGVDVVLNTLSGDFVDKSFAVLKQRGRFVELGKRDVWSRDEVRQRRPDVSYFPFDLVQVAGRDPEAIHAMLVEMTTQVEAGALQPLPRTVFPLSRVTDAFRHMAEAKHIGKIVISVPPISTSDTSTIRRDGTYLITGGVGALGLEVASFLVAQGARHLVLVSRRPATDDARSAVERLRQDGADVVVRETDVAELSQVSNLVAEINEGMPPLRGIVHAAGLLDDGVLLQQTWDRFQRVMAPKVDGAWNLHRSTRDLPLDFFVCFSSVASLIGNAGQGNYATGNAFMDALAHYRRACGLSGLSVNWGPWGEVGMAAVEGRSRQRRLTSQGFQAIAPGDGVRILGRLLQASPPQVGVVPVRWSEFLRANPSGHTFLGQVATPESKPSTPEADLRRQLEESPDPRPLVAQHVRSVVGRVLGIEDVAEVDARARLFDLGLESLMAVELRGRFQESFGCPLRSTLVFDYPTIEALVDHLVEKVASRASGTPATPARTAEEPSPDLDEPGEEELANRLAQELATLAEAEDP